VEMGSFGEWGTEGREERAGNRGTDKEAKRQSGEEVKR